MAAKKATQKAVSVEETAPETFEDGGKTYRSDPTMEEFIVDSGVAKSNVKRIMTVLEKQSVTDPSMLIYLSMAHLSAIEGIAEGVAFSLAKHGIRVKHKGSITKNLGEMEHFIKDYVYLSTGSPTLDQMMQHSDGNIGFRSKALVELYGEPASGKTQLALTTAVMTMRPKDQGGWGRGIAYIDSEGAFDVHRFKALARYWGVPDDFIEGHILYSRVDNFDEVEMAIDRISNEIRAKNLGTIIVDSIMDPLRSSYPVGGKELSNLQPRQKHLKRVLDKLKNIANIHNLLVIYTNHVRSNINIGPANTDPPIGAQGGVVLGHASDIRILLNTPNKTQREKFFNAGDRKKLAEAGLHMRRATIMDSGFLASTVSVFMIGFMGVGEPAHWSKLLEQAKQIKEKGYICVDSLGNDLEPTAGDTFISPEEQFKLTMQQLYGSS